MFMPIISLAHIQLRRLVKGGACGWKSQSTAAFGAAARRASAAPACTPCVTLYGVFEGEFTRRLSLNELATLKRNARRILRNISACMRHAISEPESIAAARAVTP
jgi:hypothetical protein